MLSKIFMNQTFVQAASPVASHTSAFEIISTKNDIPTTITFSINSCPLSLLLL